jgi:CheY-like chemotaxis protein
MVRSATVRILRRAGYRLLVADGGAEALRQAEGTAERPSLLVTDVVMPGLGGREVAAALRLRFPDVGVLFVSGYAREAIGPRELAEPRTGFLSKPFAEVELLTKVRSLLQAR